MTSLDTAQLNIARILFSLPAAGGFALAGGSALVVHGAIDRPTRDIDAFVAAKPVHRPAMSLPWPTNSRMLLKPKHGPSLSSAITKRSHA